MPEPRGEDGRRCNGVCLTAREVIYPPSGGYDPDDIAYAHPDCPLHGEHSGGDGQPE